MIGRNTYGSPSWELRGGPLGRAAVTDPVPSVPPPNAALGSVGSLYMLVNVWPGETDVTRMEKLAFGNEVDFAGEDPTSITTLKYWYLADLDSAVLPSAPPSISFEMNPGTAAIPGSPQYTSLTYVPPTLAAADRLQWIEQDTISQPQWYFTNGATATFTGCSQATLCTFTSAIAALTAASGSPTILSVQISKGRDNTFKGAVDALQINNTLYDFEPLGVVVRAIP